MEEITMSTIVGYVTLTLLGLIWVIAGFVEAFRYLMEEVEKKPWAKRGFGTKVVLSIATLLAFLAFPIGFWGALVKEGYYLLSDDYQDALASMRCIKRRNTPPASDKIVV